MHMFNLGEYSTAIDLFTRLLGAIYFFVFFAFAFQIKGLLGEQGILPIKYYLNTVRFLNIWKRLYWTPSLFWISSSNRMLMGTCFLGMLLSFVLIFKFQPALTLALLYILHLSIVSTGQAFLSFGWEMFLLEVTFNAFWINLTPAPNVLVWISLNLVLFRLYFQGGYVKLQSKDPNWRNLTALSYHYLTQPIPNAIAWYVHKFPMWFHKLSTALMFGVELFIPFLIFGTQEMRLAAFIFMFGLQYFIWLTGNFSYLNHLSVVLCLILISNHYFSVFISPITESVKNPLLLDIAVSIVGLGLILLQLVNFWHHVVKRKSLLSDILNWFYPFHIVNRYGIFAVMTTKRYEIVIEGSADGTQWKEYTFYYKPSEINRRPRRISPFQPRIDWQAWFLPFTYFSDEPWFGEFLTHLLLGNREVIKLIRHNPFPDKPPKYVRALLYDYTYSDWETKKNTGAWWNRQFIKAYSPTLSLIGKDYTSI